MTIINLMILAMLPSTLITSINFFNMRISSSLETLKIITFKVNMREKKYKNCFFEILFDQSKIGVHGLDLVPRRRDVLFELRDPRDVQFDARFRLRHALTPSSWLCRVGCRRNSVYIETGP